MTARDGAIQPGHLVRPSIEHARERAEWSGGGIPRKFIAWSAARAATDHSRVGGSEAGQVYIPWDSVGLVVSLRNPSSPGASLIATVQFPEGMVLCAVGRLELVDV